MSYSDYINSNDLASDIDIYLNTYYGDCFYAERMCRAFSIIYGIIACQFCKYDYRIDGCDLKELSRLYKYVI